MSEFRQVEGHKDLVKDMHSKAVINTNRSAYLAAVQRKKTFIAQKDSIRAVSYTHLTLPSSDLV